MDEMDETSGKTKTFWLESQKAPHYPALSRNITCDVVIIGAGIAGLSTAYNLLCKHFSVVVLEDGQMASGESGRTSAHLSSVLDDRFYKLETFHGKEGARLAAESHSEAIDWIETVCQVNNIDCGFRRVDGYLFTPPEGDASILEKEYDASQRAGLKVSWADKVPWGPFHTGKCLVYANQAQFHPTKYLAALAARITHMGGHIFTHTHATSTTGGTPAIVETKEGFRIEAKHIVVATNVPINEWVAVHTKQASYRSYVIGAIIPTGSVPSALYWDTADPYHYVRVVPKDAYVDVLLIGGEDHKTGQTTPDARPYANLEAWGRDRFPQMKKVVYAWSGQIVEPIDGLAFIGHSPFDKPNVYLATGDSGHGLTHGTIAGLLIPDLITEQPNPWTKLYNPHRIHVTAGKNFVKENVNAFGQYIDWFTPGEASEVKQIQVGEGAIVRSGLRKMAVYRHPNGGLTTLSAVCPHLKALVVWNSKEKTWDCPAHGSRFSPDGQVVNGPANSSLESISKPEKVTAAH